MDERQAPEKQQRRRWSARTLYRELERFMDDQDVDTAHYSVADLIEMLRAEIVEEAIR